MAGPSGPKQHLSHYTRNHGFNYPKFGKVVRQDLALSPYNPSIGPRERLLRKASKAEDSAFVAYKALQSTGQRRKVLFRRLKQGHVG